MAETSLLEVPCCPPLVKDDVCDVIDFHYRLNHATSLRDSSSASSSSRGSAKGHAGTSGAIGKIAGVPLLPGERGGSSGDAVKRPCRPPSVPPGASAGSGQRRWCSSVKR